MSNNDFYVPSEDEEYMSEKQLEYFRQKLLDWKKSIINDGNIALQSLKQGSDTYKEAADMASSEIEKSLLLRTRDRQRKLLSKINEALARIDSGDYGYCEETGEPITLARLDARPIATLCLQAQKKHEERQNRK